jgi:hypothetical protein
VVVACCVAQARWARYKCSGTLSDEAYVQYFPTATSSYKRITMNLPYLLVDGQNFKKMQKLISQHLLRYYETLNGLLCEAAVLHLKLANIPLSHWSSQEEYTYCLL